MKALQELWYGAGVVPRLGRVLLSPLAAAYGAAMDLRNSLYDAGALRSQDAVLPAVSVGNLTVGGTGKTPVTAWLAALLAARGRRAAIVLRGYGADEPLVHAALAPEVTVVVNGDRAAGVGAAAAAGADVIVLDDAFQHRRLRRALDVVLVSADQWRGPPRLLPAGPFRERPASLRRASLVLITRKAAGIEAGRRLRATIEAIAPGVPTALVHLGWGDLRAARDVREPSGGATRRPLADLRGRRVLAISGVADPDAFRGQLLEQGADVTARVHADHHAYTAAEARRLAAAAASHDLAVCTLKDAVKLAPLWPRQAPPLWYVSQRVVPEDAADAIEAALARVLAARGLER